MILVGGFVIVYFFCVRDGLYVCVCSYFGVAEVMQSDAFVHACA